MKVTLLGDSIRQMGYGLKVPELLGNDFKVYQPVENCRFAKYTLQAIRTWQNDMEGSDIIHWNNGIWDVGNNWGDGPLTPIDEYVRDMVRIAKVLKTKAKKVIFATTTAVRYDNPDTDNERIKAYNDAVVPELEKLGILINDLHSLVFENINEYIREDDKVHLTDAGIDACAKQVAKIISETAKYL